MRTSLLPGPLFRSAAMIAFAIVASCGFCVGEEPQYDWSDIPIPVSPENGHHWKLLDISDDFRYDAEPLLKPKAFSDRWREGFINRWKGPGLSEWTTGHAYVLNGHLAIAASRKPGTNKVRVGSISSKKPIRYPVFVEARVKISNLVLASDVWMLSEDSTQEIDIIEAYGSDRPGQEHFAHRIHLSHHVFIRDPFQDYQPTDEGSWHVGDKPWRNDFHRVGVYWRDPWHLEYFVNGEQVRVSSGEPIIDPKGFTEGKGLNKEMYVIINMEDQNWRSDQGVTPTDAELGDFTKSIMWVDWIRAYQSITD